MQHSGKSVMALLGAVLLLTLPAGAVNIPNCPFDMDPPPGWQINDSGMMGTHIIFLDAPFRSIIKRIRNPRKRGLVGFKDRSLRELFEERLVLYRKYADITVKAGGKENVSDVVDRILMECFERTV